MGKADAVIKRLKEDSNFRKLAQRDFEKAVSQYRLTRSEKMVVKSYLSNKDTQSKSGLLGELKSSKD